MVYNALRSYSKAIIRLTINHKKSKRKQRKELGTVVIEFSIPIQVMNVWRTKLSGCLQSTLRISGTLSFDQLFKYFVVVLLRLYEKHMHNMKVQMIVHLLVHVLMLLGNK